MTQVPPQRRRDPTPIDRRYRSGGHMVASSLLAWAGFLVGSVVHNGGWWLCAALPAGVLVLFGWAGVFGELAKPCRPVHDPPIHIRGLPNLTDADRPVDRGDAS